MRVACWLGPSSPNSASGMYVLLKLNEIWHKDLESTPESGIQFIRKYNAAARGHLSIIEREYWTRLWVVQEFLIPPDLLLIRGTALVTWSQLHDRAPNRDLSIAPHDSGDQRTSWGSGEKFTGLGKNTTYCAQKRIHDFPSPIHLKEIMDLGYALVDFSSLACKEPHDKIYALLSLVYERQRLPIQYEQPANIIFWQMMALMNLSQYGKNEKFSYISWRRKRQKCLGTKRESSIISSSGRKPPEPYSCTCSSPPTSTTIAAFHLHSCADILGKLSGGSVRRNLTTQKSLRHWRRGG